MQLLKFSAGVFVVVAVAHAQTAARTDKGLAKAVPAASPPNAPQPASRMMSAFPEDPDSPEAKQRQTAFAPSAEYTYQAREMYQAGDLSGAEKACLSALDAAPMIQGQRQAVPFVPHLLGQVYLKEGQYQKAIYWIRGAMSNEMVAGPGMDLDVALAYVRLGDCAHARQFYSDEATLQCCKEWTSKDLPGTDTPQSLEASILLARGLDIYMEHRHDEALVDLHRAHQLAPSNSLIAYFCADILNEKGQYANATRLYGRALANTHGIIHDDAVRHYDVGDKAVLAEPARPSNVPLF